MDMDNTKNNKGPLPQGAYNGLPLHPLQPIQKHGHVIVRPPFPTAPGPLVPFAHSSRVAFPPPPPYIMPARPPPSAVVMPARPPPSAVVMMGTNPIPPPPPPMFMSSPRPYHQYPMAMQQPPAMPGPRPQAPIMLGRAAWERGLAELLETEPRNRLLPMAKYGVHCEVPGTTQPPEHPPQRVPTSPTAGHSSSPIIQWDENPSKALDVGVITISGKGLREEEEEAYVPTGYEGAPAMVLSMHKDVLGEDSDDNDLLNALSLEDKLPPASCARDVLRIRNEAPGSYLVREVIILPRDEKDATLWLEVEMCGRMFSSKSGHGPVVVSNGRETDGSRYVNPDVFLPPGVTDALITVTAKHETEYSIVRKWVLFRLEGPSSGPAHDQHTHSFVIGRKVLATVVDTSVHSLLNVEARPFVPKALKEFFDQPCNIMYTFPTKPHPFQPAGMAAILQAMGQFHLNEQVRKNLLAYKSRPAGQQEDPYALFGILQNPTNIREYVLNMMTMLHLEEAQAAEDIRRYDLFGVPIGYRERPFDKPEAPLVATILVPGASEKRPPLAYGDEVRLRPASSPVADGPMMVEVRAVVVETKEEHVKLLLPPNFPTDVYPPETRFHVRFTYDRWGYRFLQRALRIVGTSAGHMLFPSAEEGKKKQGKENPKALVVKTEAAMGFVNPSINEEQRQAVMDIVNHAYAPLPYILFGPPGTGKTLTVIEAILQICRHHPDAKVLAVAPSDVAADIIAERLSYHLGPDKLFRLNWYQRLVASIKPGLLRYSYMDDKASLFSLPADNPWSILDRQVIVCTCATSGVLSLLQRPGHPVVAFSHILVDESSQALQPEVMVPLSLASPTTNVVLAGDPKQLGAITRNRLVQQLGLAKSLQEQLMTRAVYDVHHVVTGSDAAQQDGPPRCITKLVKNYRSHQAIIEVPSRLFYDKALEQCGDETLINSMLEWEMLPGSSSSSAALGMAPTAVAGGRGGGGGFPILFYGVLGQHQHELDSPSFFNVVECAKILDLIQALLSSKRVKVNLQDIAVISAFRKQVLKLRVLLRDKGYGAINVGQVEDFQGQEFKITIISTVLSARHPSELHEQLGFLGHPKRFNVAITRSQALTIIVGNPFALWEDTAGWKDLLLFCADHGAIRGSSGPLNAPDVDSIESFLDTIANNSLLGKASADDIFPTALEDYFSDSPWRLLL